MQRDIRMRDQEIKFLDYKYGDEKDDYGNPVEKPILSETVIAELLSISQTEFYQAQTSEHKPEIKFKITDYLDYDGQKYVVYGNVRYTVLRTYRTKNNELEITCYGGVRDAIAAVSDQD